MCITYTANQFIAHNSNLIIAYDVSPDIVRSLENLETSIVRVFLIAKQTADDARFHYLKNLGKSSNIDFKNINEFLRSGEKVDDIKMNNGENNKPRFKLSLSPDLYESTLPYLFPEKNFIRYCSTDFQLPGFKINESHFFIIISPDTIENCDFQGLSSNIKKICQDLCNIQVLIFPESFETLRIEYRSEILNNFRKNDVLVIYVKSYEEIFSYVKSMLKKV